MKKLILLFLTVIIVTTFAGLNINFTVNAETNTDGYYTYTVADGKATITGVDTLISGTITIPSTLGGYPVTTIGPSAFFNCTKLICITFPDSIKYVRDNAFYGCKNLTKINITDLTAWCKIHFYDATSNPLTYAKSLYLNDELITDLTISDTYIGWHAFANCTSIISLSISENVSTIGDGAFVGCTELKRITIPKNIKYFGSYAFSGCRSLSHVFYSGSLIGKNEINFQPGNDSIRNDATWHFYDCSCEICNCKNHIYDVSEITKKATCTTTGTKIYYCKYCDFTKSETINATGHKMSAPTITKQATCNDNGLKESVCSVCKTKSVQTVPKLDHKFNEFTITKKATATETGIKTATCTACGERKEEVIPIQDGSKITPTLNVPGTSAETTPTTEPTVTGTPITEPQTQPIGIAWYWLVIVGGAALVIGGATCVFIIKRKQ